jgi:hypothetical protein
VPIISPSSPQLAVALTFLATIVGFQGTREKGNGSLMNNLNSGNELGTEEKVTRSCKTGKQAVHMLIDFRRTK